MEELSPLRPPGASTILRSSVLAGDSKLEAAAMFDSDRILPGAIGPHVARIQLALNEVSHAHLVPDGVYGPRTDGAVLAFKSRHGIVERSRQNQIDGSVDRRTILALDEELLDTRWQRRHLHHHGR